MSTLTKRILSALVMAPVALGAVWSGGIWYFLFVSIVGLLMAWEWTGLTEGNPWLAQMWVLAAGVFVTTTSAFAGTPGFVAVAVLVTGIVCAGIARVRTRNPVWAGLAIFYIGLPVAFLIILRNDTALGLEAVIWLLLVVWATDVFAYFAGKSIGGPKLAPKASPNKTWAGLLGGIAGASIVGAVVAAVLNQESMAFLAILSGVLAVIAQIGDIAESAMKRHFNVKDSSSLIPGHGGVMDRVDGLVTVVALAGAIGWYRGGMDEAARGILIW